MTINIHDIILEYYNRNKEEYDTEYSLDVVENMLNININTPVNIPESYADKFNMNEELLDRLCEFFFSSDLKQLSEISKEMYNKDYIGYPELTTLCKNSHIIYTMNFDDKLINFICECIKYIYDNYEHELP